MRPTEGGFLIELYDAEAGKTVDVYICTIEHKAKVVLGKDWIEWKQSLGDVDGVDSCDHLLPVGHSPQGEQCTV